MPKIVLFCLQTFLQNKMAAGFLYSPSHLPFAIHGTTFKFLLNQDWTEAILTLDTLLMFHAAILVLSAVSDVLGNSNVTFWIHENVPFQHPKHLYERINRNKLYYEPLKFFTFRNLTKDQFKTSNIRDLLQTAKDVSIILIELQHWVFIAHASFINSKYIPAVLWGVKYFYKNMDDFVENSVLFENA